jgi:hypothetical protein
MVNTILRSEVVLLILSPDFKFRFEKPSNLELATYLADAAGPVPLVRDLRLAHGRWGSSSNPSLNGRQ